MNVLLLGTGMQGRVALHDLVVAGGVERVTAADRDLNPYLSLSADLRVGVRLRCGEGEQDLAKRGVGVRRTVSEDPVG